MPTAVDKSREAPSRTCGRVASRAVVIFALLLANVVFLGIVLALPATAGPLLSPGPDLTVQAIDTTPATIIISRSFVLTVSVANLGTTDATGPFQVHWYLDPATEPVSTTAGVYSWTVASLASGVTETLTTTWTITTTGVHTFYAQVDVGDAVAEDDENNNLLGPLIVTVERAPIYTYMPLVCKGCWPGMGSQSRFGFVVHTSRGEVTNYNVAYVRAGWYLDYRYLSAPPRPAGLEYMQVVRVKSYPPNWTALGAAIDNNPGSWWLIGNEPDRKGWQDDRTPAEYAPMYHEIYHFIKNRDPTAKVAAGGIVQPTPLRLQYLNMVLAEYQNLYGASLPADGWHIHNMILREASCDVYPPTECWGAGIPPGINVNQGMLYDVQDNDNMTYFWNQIIAFRQWMKNNGYQNMPLIVSEYGVLMPAEYGFDQNRVINFMYSTFNHFLNYGDCSLGYPADGCRLVQRWAWYSLNDLFWTLDCYYSGSDDCGFNGNLFNPYNGQVTAFGTAYRNRPYY